MRLLDNCMFLATLSKILRHPSDVKYSCQTIHYFKSLGKLHIFINIISNFEFWTFVKVIIEINKWFLSAPTVLKLSLRAIHNWKGVINYCNYELLSNLAIITLGFVPLEGTWRHSLKCKWTQSDDWEMKTEGSTFVI